MTGNNYSHVTHIVNRNLVYTGNYDTYQYIKRLMFLRGIKCQTREFGYFVYLTEEYTFNMFIKDTKLSYFIDPLPYKKKV